MRAQEVEWMKSKAVLEQRIEILEIQNREIKEREHNLQSTNRSIMAALEDIDKHQQNAQVTLIFRKISSIHVPRSRISES